jgi:Glyoxalase-like domain
VTPERVTGIGGVFVRANDPERLCRWYAEHLGIELQPYGGATFRASEEDVTVWLLAPQDDPYFGPSDQHVMLNFRVRALDAMLKQLRAAE